MVAKRRGVNATRLLRRIKKFTARIIYLSLRLVSMCLGCAERMRGTGCTNDQLSVRLAISNFSSVDGFPRRGSSVGFHHLARR
jgi:hypothetical protein